MSIARGSVSQLGLYILGLVNCCFQVLKEVPMSQKWKKNYSCWEMMVYETNYINWETLVIVQYSVSGFIKITTF